MRLLDRLRGEAVAFWIFMLMALAGALNAAGFLAFGQTLSHMTGNLTKLGLGAVGQIGDSALMFLAFLLCFLLGATLTGYAFPDEAPAQWRRCGWVLSTGGLLLVAAELLAFPVWLRIALTACVLGCQNGLALRYRGVLSRTTHVTGHLTDLGAAIGRMVQKRDYHGPELRRTLFHLGCLLGFLLGVALLAACARLLPAQPATSLIALCGAAYALLGLMMLMTLKGKVARANGPAAL